MVIADAGYYLAKQGLRSSTKVMITGFRMVCLLPEEAPNRCQLCVVYWNDDIELMASFLLKRSPEDTVEFISKHDANLLMFTGRLAPHERYTTPNGLDVMPFTGILTSLDDYGHPQHDE